MYYLEAIDPAPYLQYGGNGLIALLVTIGLGFLVTIVGSILYAERIRGTLAAKAEATRDAALIGVITHNTDTLERVHGKLMDIDSRLGEHADMDAARFTTIEQTLMSREVRFDTIDARLVALKAQIGDKS